MRYTGSLRGHGASGLAESAHPAGLGAAGGQHPGQAEGDDQAAGGQQRGQSQVHTGHCLRFRCCLFLLQSVGGLRGGVDRQDEQQGEAGGEVRAGGEGGEVYRPAALHCAELPRSCSTTSCWYAPGPGPTESSVQPVLPSHRCLSSCPTNKPRH